MTIEPRSPGRAVAMAIHALSFLLCLLAFAPSRAESQQAERIEQLAESDTLYEVRLGDGSTYFGRVEGTAADTISLRGLNGVRVQFHRAQIVAVRPAEGRVVNDEFWREDANNTRLFFAPTGRTLDAGDGYAGLFFVFPFVGYGVSDAVTLAGGLPLIGGSGGGLPFFYLAPKLRVLSTASAQVSTGVLAILGADDGGEDGNAVLGVAYGVGTFGSSDRAVTVGAGVPFASSDGAADAYVLMIGAETRVTRRMKLLTENWAIPGEEGALLTGGIRLMGERWTTDLGLAAPVSSDGLFYFPIVSFAYAFGGGR